MRKLALALIALLGSIASANAACTSPAVMHDFPGTAFNMSLATNAGDGNCASNIAIVGTLPAYTATPTFKFDQTTPGTTNGVQVNAALPAGTNLLGKVGIDQTTPGTTNGVQVNAALPAGTNLMGKVGIDQTTPGTTNGVQVNAALPAGTNTIGNVNSAVNVTATDCSGSISSGGTAQNAFSAQSALHGFTVVNIDTTEPMWISFTTTAAASGSGSYPLQAATATTFASPGSFTSPTGFGLNHAVSVIAATTSHKFSCTWW